MEKKTNNVSYEGKDKAHLDVDRMINEGLAGGTVHATGSKTNIEEARSLQSEEQSHNTK